MAASSQIQQQIAQAATQAGIDPSVALAVAQHESGFVPTAQNPGSSAAGVFQLTAATQATLGVTNPYDATQNINAGVGLLASYFNKYGNWSDALQAFSQGPGTVGQAPSSQTIGLINYVAGQSSSVSPYSGGGSGDGSGANAGAFDWTWVLWGGAALMLVLLLAAPRAEYA